MWSEPFERAVRGHLHYLPRDVALEPDAPLRDLGLDSLGAVDLLADLEAGFGVRFTDEALDLDTFSTAGTLWTTLSSLPRVEGAAQA